jgi:hypothetical protein
MKMFPHSLIVLISFSLLATCSSETDQPGSTKNVPATDYSISKIATICDCNDFALQLINEMVTLRKNYASLDAFSQDSEAAKQMNVLLEQWRELQSHCLQTYQRAVFEESECNHPSLLQEKRTELHNLGIQT